MSTTQGLPPGQYWGKKWIIYAALGVPKVNAETWRLRIDGQVKNPVEFTYSELIGSEQTKYEKPFQCVTKWGIEHVQWEGVSIRSIAARAEPNPEAKWVMFHCEDGYSAPVPTVDALSEDAIVAFKINGTPLSTEQGFPARPYMPNLYGWKSAKWLNRIEFMNDYQDGYWEMYGYHERANIWAEERFKGGSGKHSKRTAVGTAW
ncbi:MAG: sulfite oxidase-like oxidoreductase [Thaumarchaeota archaeon]|nr:sulfite oxidase-like oxidoreductase [Nitrososphaerota archaeon]